MLMLIHSPYRVNANAGIKFICAMLKNGARERKEDEWELKKERKKKKERERKKNNSNFFTYMGIFLSAPSLFIIVNYKEQKEKKGFRKNMCVLSSTSRTREMKKINRLLMIDSGLLKKVSAELFMCLLVDVFVVFFSGNKFKKTMKFNS